MKIYFAGSIAGGREDAGVYHELIKHLQSYGEVLTEHIGNDHLIAQQKSIGPQQIHDRDVNWLMESDVVVAEVSIPSLGVGYEIGKSLENGKKVICLYRNGALKELSPMIFGSGAEIAYYGNVREAQKKLNIIFKNL